MVYDDVQHLTLLFGGLGAANDLWSWDGAAWSLLEPAGGPLPADYSMMGSAYDSNRQRLVLFGGFDSTAVIGSTWEYDLVSGTWELRTPSTVPPARAFPSMVYDSNRQVVIMFGGGENYVQPYAALSDTWEYDGTDWTLVSVANAPAPRVASAAAYDSDTGAMLLFGGLDTANFGDTWAYQNGVWTELAPTFSPPAGRSQEMVYDPVRRCFVMFGGHDGSTLDNRIWQFDGVDWEDASHGTLPASRRNFGMVFDTLLEQVVIYSGFGVGADTWTTSYETP